MANIPDSEDLELVEDQGFDPGLDPVTNPDAQEALSLKYSNVAVLVIPLKSGRFAILDRGYNLHIILDEPPSSDEIRALSLSFSVSLSWQVKQREAGIFFGEPSIEDQVRDLRAADKKPKRKSQAIDIDLDSLL
jgi:hypothetical protein